MSTRMGNGRLESELSLRAKIENMLRGQPPILTEFYYDMKGDDKAYSTIKNYVSYVIDFMHYVTNGKEDDLFYRSIDSVTIKQYIGSLGIKTDEGNIIRIGGSIQATRWSALNAFFTFLVVNNYIDQNPMTKTKRPKHRQARKVVYLTQDEINFVFKEAAMLGTPMLKNRDLCILAFGFSTGLRVSAIAQINYEDINFANNTIRVIEKGNKEREITIGTCAKQYLSKWLVDRANLFGMCGNGPLFLSKAKKRITVYAIEDMVKKYTCKLGKHVTPHVMRKTAAMTLVGAGYSPQSIMKMLGHENIQTTMFYVDALNSEETKIANTLDTLLQ